MRINKRAPNYIYDEIMYFNDFTNYNYLQNTIKYTNKNNKNIY
jgi:hypothetical protein